MDHDDEAIASLSVHDCLDRLREHRVGRLAVSRPGAPDVLPVNYVVDHGTVVFRTAPGTKLAAMSKHDAVTFEVDGFDPRSGDAWSVIIKGRTQRIEALHEVVAAADLPLSSWQPTPKPLFVRVVPDEMTGRRFRAQLLGTRRSPLPPPACDE